VFNTTWTADSASDIDVYAHADGVEADDATQLVSTTEYNVTFVGTYETVRVTFTTGRVLDDIITIVRNTPSTRDNLYTNTNFTPSMLNQDFGVRTLVEQQNQMYNLDFAPHYNLSCTYTDNSNLNIDIILPILGENQFWVKNLLNTKSLPQTCQAQMTCLLQAHLSHTPKVHRLLMHLIWDYLMMELWLKL